ncbi:MAG TPA: ADOP family duplicated permease [Thermoanaerobaculia bacterium]|nr:ADOP family duplicated permease [Thermoanaerobaculia bacterium]
MRIALRTLLKSPAFAVLSVLVLAIAIGAATAMFSLVDDLLLQPLQYRDPSRVVLLWQTRDGERRRSTAYDFQQLQSEARSFANVAAFGSVRLDLTGSGEPVSLYGARVTSEYLDALGVRPLHGRAIAKDDVDVVILGHNLWRRRFGANPNVVGKTVRLDEKPRTVIGVLAPGPYPMTASTSGRDVFSPSAQDFLIPARFNPKYARMAGVLCVVARLKPGVSPAAAAAESSAIVGHPAEIVLASEELTRDIRTPLAILFASVALVLLVAIANVVALFIVRTIGRRRTFAVMLASGATQTRVALRVVAEAIWIAAAAGAAGVVLSVLFVQAVLRFVPREVPRLADVSLDARVLLFAACASVAAAILCGLLPGLHAARRTSTSALHNESRASGGAASRNARRLLAVLQIALAVVLVVATALLTRAYRRAFAADRGFNAAQVAMANLTLPSARYSEAHRVISFADRALEELRRVPGVRDAAVSYERPLHGDWINSFEIVGRSGGEEPSGRFCPITPDFFRTLGIELLRGRVFTANERAAAVIINETLARRYFTNIEPLGQRLRVSPPSSVWGDSMPKEFQIVGVVEDIRLLAKDSDRDAMFFIPWTQGPLTDISVTVRTTDLASLQRAFPTIVHALDRNLPAGAFTTLDEQIASRLGQPRFTAVLISFFGAIALLLAMTGVFGLLTENVLQQTRALGIRMAFGARGRDLFRLIVREGLALLAAGAVAGAVASWSAARALRHFIEGVDVADFGAYAQVSVLLLLATLVASVIPALRAARTDPSIALRHE